MKSEIGDLDLIRLESVTFSRGDLELGNVVLSLVSLNGDCTVLDTPDISQLSDAQALAQLQSVLAPRIAQAEKGEFSKQTFAEIAQQA